MNETHKLLGIIGSMASAGKAINVPAGQLLAVNLQNEGYRVVIASDKKIKLLRLLDTLLTIIRYRNLLDFIIIQVYSGLGFILVDAASWIGSLLKIPLIFHVHGGNIPEFLARYPKWSIRVLKRSTAFVCPSQYLTEALSHWGFDPVVIPNYVEICHYPFRLRSHPQPKLIWLRAFHEIYNPLMVPRMMKKLGGDQINANINMAGPDKGDGSLQAMIELGERLSINYTINVLGKIEHDHVPKFLSEGDIFINTTNVDNTPVSLIEAMACGLCIVSTNVGGIPYLVEDGLDGLLVPPDDAAAMAAAVQKLLNDPGLAERLSSNARRKAEGFDWEHILPLWEALFVKLERNG